MHHYIYIDSKNRTEPSGNSYTLSLTSTLRDITQVDLVSAKVPNTIYNITQGSNVLAINNSNVSMPPGFYSAAGLACALPLNVDFLSDEGKFIMYSNSAFTLALNTDEIIKATGNLQGTSTLAGSDRPLYSGQNILVSQNIVDLSTNEYLFLDIAELRSTTGTIDTKKFTGNTFSGSTVATLFGMIPLDVRSGDIKTFKEESDYKVRLRFKTPLGSLSKVSVRWVDKNGNQVNFNGFDNNSIVLRVHTKDPKEPEPEPIQEIRYVPLPAPPLPPPPSKGAYKWILYLVFSLILGGSAWYLFSNRG